MAEHPKDHNRRRLYLVNPKFQFRFMAIIALAVLIGFTVLYISNLWYFDMLVEQGFDLGLDPSHPYYELVEDQRKLLTNTYLVVSSIIFVVLMWGGFFLSHRIAGPIYRIESYVKQATAGEVDPKPVRLRKGDFFLEIASILNDAIAHLQKDSDSSNDDSLGNTREDKS